MAKIQTKKNNKINKGEEFLENLEVNVEEEPTDEVTITGDEDENIEISVEEEPSVVIDEEALAPKVTKMVRIKLKEKMKCFIGEWYYFEANKVYSVPEDVKRVLMNRDKLLPM